MRDFLALLVFFALIVGPAVVATFTPIDGTDESEPGGIH